MNRFHGDLLMGGVRLRELDGEIDEVVHGDDELWSGRFRVDRKQQSLFEIGRPYLLVLDDGRSGQVEVTNITGEEDREAVLIRFRPVTRPK